MPVDLSGEWKVVKEIDSGGGFRHKHIYIDDKYILLPSSSPTNCFKFEILSAKSPFDLLNSIVLPDKYVPYYSNGYFIHFELYSEGDSSKSSEFSCMVR